jgi:alpha-ketoglutarate-dependent taurine dioxygenase
MMSTLAETATRPAFLVRPLAPFGVELEGDLSQPLAAEDRARLVELVDEHGIVVARDQQLTMDQHRKLLEPLGRISELNFQAVALDDKILNRDKMGFHSDLAYAHTPYKYASLHALDLVAGESSTYFANGALAYRKLSAGQRKRLAPLTTTAVWGRRTHRDVGYDVPADGPRAVRAAVIHHHRTAQPILYVNEIQHCRFNELCREESDALLAELFAILYAPGAILTHDWRPGDLLIWDNLALQHGRPGLEHLSRRRLQRVTVADVSGEDMLPQYIKLDM